MSLQIRRPPRHGSMNSIRKARCLSIPSSARSGRLKLPHGIHRRIRAANCCLAAWSQTRRLNPSLGVGVDAQLGDFLENGLALFGGDIELGGVRFALANAFVQFGWSKVDGGRPL